MTNLWGQGITFVETFKNETINKTVKVVVDRGGYGYGGEVFDETDILRGIEGHRLDQDGINKLFSYWHSAGHKVKEVTDYGR